MIFKMLLQKREMKVEKEFEDKWMDFFLIKKEENVCVWNNLILYLLFYLNCLSNV
jgi:hypothetical protein